MSFKNFLHWILIPLGIGLLVIEPSLAGNKFETISSGVTGSFKVKREYVEIILYCFSAFTLLAAILSIVLPHDNPLFLNCVTWKQSAILWAVTSAIFASVAVFVL